MSEEDVKTTEANIEDIATAGAIELSNEKGIDLFSLLREDDKKISKKDVEEHLKSLEEDVEEDVEATYSTICKGKFEILGVEIVDGFKLDSKLKENEKFMKRFNHAISIGVIKKG